MSLIRDIQTEKMMEELSEMSEEDLLQLSTDLQRLKVLVKEQIIARATPLILAIDSEISKEQIASLPPAFFRLFLLKMRAYKTLSGL